MSNKAWQIAVPGSVVLRTLDAHPSLGPNQVLVCVKAISLNYRDILVVDHSADYATKNKVDLIPGSDAAGILEAIGSDVTGWSAGDRVGLHPNSWIEGDDPRSFILEECFGAASEDGTLQEYILCNANRLWSAPASFSLEETATMSTAGQTAYRALFHGGSPELGPGSTVLTQGTGGVSCWAIQLAAAAGATVVATSSSDEKLKLARDLGAKHTINYRTVPRGDWAAEALRLTDGAGVDIVVDVVGGSGLNQSITSLRKGGRVALLGILDKEDKPVAITKPLLFGAKSIISILSPGSARLATEFSAFCEKHELHPPIAKVFPFDQADKAIDALRTLDGVGKIVITV